MRDRLFPMLTVVAVGLSLSLMWSDAAPPEPGSAEMQWKTVEKAMREGLPKTAIERIDTMLPTARQSSQHDWAILALATKATLQASLNGGGEEERLFRLQSELSDATAPEKPILRVILANWFWQYYQQNQWRFRDRTSVESLEDAVEVVQSADDLKTWDRQRIQRQALTWMEAALADVSTLRNTPLSRFDAILADATAPSSYRPTLYDFLVENAIDLNADIDATYAGPLDRFELLAESPILDDVDSFLAWRLPDGDAESPMRRSVGLLQNWLRFHRDDSDPTTRLEVDLFRLRFASEHAGGPDLNQRYAAALGRMIAEHGDHEVSARASYQLARIRQNEGELVVARQIALKAQRRHPTSFGGRDCLRLIHSIEAPSIELGTEHVWNPSLESGSKPIIRLSYKNLTRVYFRLVRLPADAGWNDDMDDVVDARPRWLDVKPTAEWTVDLPATADFQTATQQIPAVTNGPSGGYVLYASSSEDFQGGDAFVASTRVWNSTLSLVTRYHSRTYSWSGYVLDGKSGEPISGATIRLLGRNERGGKWATVSTLRSGTDGRFDIRSNQQRELRILASHGGQTILSSNRLSMPRRRMSYPRDRTSQAVLFTDRSIYRPGQRVRFKAIFLSADRDESDYRVIDSQSVTIELVDANGQTVKSRQMRTNRFGSVHGDFEIPRIGLTGQFMLRAGGQGNGITRFRVEEYKRPKFDVELESSDEPKRLGQTIQMRGHAVAFNGAPIDGATVRYRVVREVDFPSWWWYRCWWMPPNATPPQTIVESNAVTDQDGHFRIEFDAVPDADADGPATFRYSVTAEVTDTTGETRSVSQTIAVGKVMMTAELSVDRPDWLLAQQPVNLRARTRSLQGSGVSAEIRLDVFSLVSPDRVVQPPIQPGVMPRLGDGAEVSPTGDPNSWATDERILTRDLTTDAGGSVSTEVRLPAGHYRAVLTTTDSAGEAVTAVLPLRVIDPDANQCELRTPVFLAVQSESLEPGETMEAIVGTGYESMHALVEVHHRGKALQRYWTDGEATQVRIKHDVDESLRGGFTVHITMVHDNRLSSLTRRIDVPWTDRKWDITWETFRSKLKPGQESTWTAVIRNIDDDLDAAAEMVATLYDASLDALSPHRFARALDVFYRDRSWLNTRFENRWQNMSVASWFGARFVNGPILSYPRFRGEILNPYLQRSGRGVPLPMSMAMESGPMMMDAAAPVAKGRSMNRAGVAAEAASGGVGDVTPPDNASSIDLSDVGPRKNLTETAFFFPTLTSDDQGKVTMRFTMPEALTRWRLLGLAHGTDLSSGFIDATAVTSKELMVQPNPPRVLRAGDEVELTVKVINRSATAQSGDVALNFRDPATGESVDAAMDNGTPRQSFDIPAGRSQSFSWRCSIPDELDLVTYTAVASTGRLSDGEEGYLPILSRKVMVHESIALSVHGQESKQFNLRKLQESAGKESIDHQSLTVQMTSNPTWYAVMALPYLMEFPHECAEQSFNRLYANLLARHVATSDPRVEQVLQLWRRQPNAAGRTTLDSPLEQNPELRQIALTESPWVAEAKTESDARQRIGQLFDTNRLRQEVTQIQSRLEAMQLADGSFPWFPGGHANRFMTMIIATGYGRLRHLGVDVDASIALKAVAAMDRFATKSYQAIQDDHREKNHLTPTIAMYLYGRSFFMDDVAVADANRESMDYWTDQARRHWLTLPGSMSQAHVAMAMHRLGHHATAGAIVKSLSEQSTTDEQGMHIQKRGGWAWHQSDIEAQAMLIEVMDEIAGDPVAVQRCQEWLLRQKQTRAWKTTKATADAVYALILRGDQPLSSTDLVDVRVGQQAVPQDSVEAGTGFYQHRWSADQVTAEMGLVTVTKTTPGIAWGGVHWQYLVDIDDVTSHEATPLRIQKQLFVVRNTDAGESMEPITDRVELSVGETIVSRLILRTDRELEFVHLRDHRGSGTEPTNVLSSYRFQDGLAVYRSTRDAAEHFFIDRLPRGAYVLESRSRIQLKGRYQAGLAHIESMYAPQYNSHSESHLLNVP
ncbi:MAG: MG2 domain-containing protein [Planctomycetota bacterium]